MSPQTPPGVPSPESILEAAAQLFEDAAWSSANRQIEADLRHDLFPTLQRFCLDAIGLSRADIRQEGTGVAGRFDSLFGSAVLEYKKPHLLDSPAERAAAAQQALGYLGAPDLDAKVVVLTDGSTWGILRDVDAGPEPGEQAWLDLDLDHIPTSPIQRFAWRSNSQETAQRVLSLLSTVRAAPVTSTSLNARLGPARPEAVLVMRMLAQELSSRGTGSRADTLFMQWIRLAGVAYGIASRDQEWPAPPLEILGPALEPPLSGLSYAEAVFVLHTYVSIATKLVACETLALLAEHQELRPTQWASMTDEDLAANLVSLERGAITAALRATDILAGDLFSWYAPTRAPSLVAAFRGLLYAMSELAWARIANAGGIALDLLRELYHAIVPGNLRKALGEFFTPRYLAECVLGQALALWATSSAEPDRKPRILDPACGSGTFLVAALRRGLVELSAAGKADDPAEIQLLVDRLYGFDINPVSPTMTRVNLLLALGDRAQLLPEIRFHVYEADSILLPMKQPGQMQLGQTDTLTIKLEVADIELPTCLATLDGMALLRQHVEASLASNRDSATYATRLARDLTGILPPEDVSDSTAAATAIYETIRALSLEGKNGVWARVIEQAFAPRVLGPVDVVVGNPPWVSWKDLPQSWKDRSQSTWDLWGLWQRRARGSGIPLSDISTLLVARSLATYTASGIVAFLLPQSVVRADPSQRHFRRCRLQSDASTWTASEPDRSAATNISFAPVFLDDFTALNPFSPDADNLPIALYMTPNRSPSFPIPHRTWKRARRGIRLLPQASWAEMRPRLACEEGQTEPVDRGDISSPWVPAAADDELALLSPQDPRAHSWGRGFETRGLDGYFVVRLETDTPVGPEQLVRIRNCPELGDNTREEPSRAAVVEASLVWPLLKGQDVQPWTAVSSGLYAIVPYAPPRYDEPLTRARMIEHSPRMFDYLEPWIDRMAARSLYRDSGDSETPWVLSGPFIHLNPTAYTVAVRYIAQGGTPAAAVCAPAFDPAIGRVTTPLPNNKTNIYVTSSRSEAHYLAAWINSPAARQSLARYAVSTGVTPRALARLPIARYDASDPNHRRLAELSEFFSVEAEGGRLDLASAQEAVAPIVHAIALRASL